ncbi:hypothetical protein [Streptomyces sp. NPDC002932]|uniref:hypothetical protein n=1 Tax=Streptomyces sp. NPDC002932 TaxID=3364672 RepID=UPI0036C02F74
MSRSVDIDFLFESPVSPRAVLQRLRGDGFGLSRDGYFSYLLDGEEGFDWNRKEERFLDAAITEMESDRWVGFSVGVTANLPNSTSAGEFVFQPDRLIVSFLVTVNRKNIPGSTFCDMGWYLRTLCPSFEALGATGVETADVA